MKNQQQSVEDIAEKIVEIVQNKQWATLISFLTTTLHEANQKGYSNGNKQGYKQGLKDRTTLRDTLLEELEGKRLPQIENMVLEEPVFIEHGMDGVKAHHLALNEAKAIVSKVMSV